MLQLKKVSVNLDQEKARNQQLEQRVDDLCSQLTELSVKDTDSGRSLSDEIAAELEARVRRLDGDRDMLKSELLVGKILYNFIA